MHSITKNISKRYAPQLVRFATTKQDLIEILECKIERERKKVVKFRKQHGNTKVGEITVNQLYGGMRGMLGFVCDTSNLDAEKGIHFRGLSLPDIQTVLPKAVCGKEPLPEGIFWLMLTEEIPTEDNVNYLSQEWSKNSKLPDYVVKIMNTLPKDLHPMTQFSIGVASLNKNSKFNEAYAKRIKRTDYWKSVLDDTMEMLGKLPPLAAMIYNNSFKNGDGCYEADPKLDWAANFANMLGYDEDNFIELMRLYLTIHCDHEGGNVSAHTCHLVGSALSDPYLAFAAGLNGLAGPLHGLANQEVLIWLDELMKVKGNNPSKEAVKEFCMEYIKQPGKVIPGYGHAVLRISDPRYTCQSEFAQRVIPNDPLVKLVATVYKVVPTILKSLGKVSNPWPNVDAHSGVLLRHFGLKESSYYTVLFGVSRALGLMAQLIWARALSLPIERPDTINTQSLMELAAKDKRANTKDTKC